MGEQAITEGNKKCVFNRHRPAPNYELAMLETTVRRLAVCNCSGKGPQCGKEQVVHLAQKLLQSHGGLSIHVGAAAGGHHWQPLFLHDSLVCCLQGQLAPPGLIVEGCQGWPCPPVTLQVFMMSHLSLKYATSTACCNQQCILVQCCSATESPPVMTASQDVLYHD